MAKITRVPDAPQDLTHFTLGQVSFDLDSKGTYTTDDPEVLSNALVSPFLSVEYDVVAPADAPADTRDQNDPHVNPAADHLSVWGSQESKDAADANDAAIKEAFGTIDGEGSQDPAPTVAETLQATFDNAGVDSTPQTPDVDPATPPVDPTPVTPDPVPTPVTPDPAPVEPVPAEETPTDGGKS